MVAVGYEPRKNEFRIKHKLDFGPLLRIYHHLQKLERHMVGYPSAVSRSRGRPGLPLEQRLRALLSC